MTSPALAITVYPPLVWTFEVNLLFSQAVHLRCCNIYIR